MNWHLIKELILKDWFLNRYVILLYTALGGIAIFLMSVQSKMAFYIGSVLFISTLIGAGIHLTMATIVVERKEMNLAFIMSLPVSITDYTVAKIISNLTIFLVTWVLLLLGSIGLILLSVDVPNGMLPATVLICVEILVAYALFLGVGLVTESEAWTIIVVVLCNLLFNLFLFYVANRPDIGPYMEGATAVWNAGVFQILGIELGAIILILAATFYFQGRKRDFI